MNRRHALAAFTLTAALLLSGGCSASGEVDGDYGGSSDVADCDAGDRRKKEIPDCGRKVNGKYREWSWVAVGKSKPPAGWKASQDTAGTTGSSSAPKKTTGKKTTTGGGDTTTKRKTTRSGTTGRRR